MTGSSAPADPRPFELGVPLVFLVAAVIALVLSPLVALLQRGRPPRGLVVLAVYTGSGTA